MQDDKRPNELNSKTSNCNNKSQGPISDRKSSASAIVNDKQQQQPQKMQHDQQQQTAVNFMSKFRDKDTRMLKNLNSQQFIEVWNNYDKDGEYFVLRDLLG